MAATDLYGSAMSELYFLDEEKDSIRKTIERLFCTRNHFGCWTRVSRPNQGRPILVIKGRNLAAHRVSYAVYKGPIPKDLYVCHRCSNKQCVNPDHLELGTPQDNINDFIRKTSGRGKEPLFDPTTLKWPPSSNPRLELPKQSLTHFQTEFETMSEKQKALLRAAFPAQFKPKEENS